MSSTCPPALLSEGWMLPGMHHNLVRTRAMGVALSGAGFSGARSRDVSCWSCLQRKLASPPLIGSLEYIALHPSDQLCFPRLWNICLMVPQQSREMESPWVAWHTSSLHLGANLALWQHFQFGTVLPKSGVFKK